MTPEELDEARRKLNHGELNPGHYYPYPWEQVDQSTLAGYHYALGYNHGYSHGHRVATWSARLGGAIGTLTGFLIYMLLRANGWLLF